MANKLGVKQSCEYRTLQGYTCAGGKKKQRGRGIAGGKGGIFLGHAAIRENTLSKNGGQSGFCVDKQTERTEKGGEGGTSRGRQLTKDVRWSTTSPGWPDENMQPMRLAKKKIEEEIRGRRKKEKKNGIAEGQAEATGSTAHGLGLGTGNCEVKKNREFHMAISGRQKKEVDLSSMEQTWNLQEETNQYDTL